MLHPVPGNERHLSALDGPNRDRGGRLSVRGVDVDFPDVLEKRIEARSSEDPDPDGLAFVPVQAVFSFVLEFRVLPDSSDDFDVSEVPVFSDLAAPGVEASPPEDSALSPPLLEAAPAFDLESVA